MKSKPTNSPRIFFTYLLLAAFFLGCSGNEDEEPGIDLSDYKLRVYNDTRRHISIKPYIDGERQASWQVTAMNDGTGVGRTAQEILGADSLIISQMVDHSNNIYNVITYVRPDLNEEAFNASIDRHFYNLDNWEELEGEDNIILYTFTDADFQ